MEVNLKKCKIERIKILHSKYSPGLALVLAVKKNFKSLGSFHYCYIACTE